MSRPLYAVLAANYPRKPHDGVRGMDTAALYESIGHPEYAQNMYMANTCAVRVSLALVAAGVPITPGHMTVKAGKYAGRRIEQGQMNLSKFLLRHLGEPERFASGYDASVKIGQRRGIVSFFHLASAADAQGHIDLVEPATQWELKCAGACYWSAHEVWFWPLR
jgi:hypothetical protein